MKILALLLSALVLAQTVNVVVILHNHQPWYIDLERGELVLPWVRMHAVGNYLKVPLLINQTGVSVAFTLSGSLIEQLNWYANGTYLDARFKISEKLARGEALTAEEKYSMKSFNKPPQTYGISYVVNPYFISAWIHGTGGYYFDDKTEKQGLTDPRTIAGFQFFKTYIMPYVAPNPTDYNTQVSLFLSGQTPCMRRRPPLIATK